MIGMEWLILGVSCFEYLILWGIIWGNEYRVQYYGRIDKNGGYMYIDAWFKKEQ